LFKKIEAVKVAPIRLPHPTGPISPGGPARNAIGVVPVDARAGATHFASIPANPGTGLPISARSSVYVSFGQTAVPVPPRGLVNGAPVQHVGSGPGTLGGPARVATGINGTTFKPKH
jgi:hypothetical protein